MGEILSMEEYLTKEDEKTVLSFVSALTKLDMIKIFGCAQILGVKVAEDMPEGIERKAENLKIRPTEDIMSEMIDAFLAKNRKDKRGILALLKAAK